MNRPIPITPPVRISAKEKIDEIERELEMRRRVYPGWIAQGKMTLTQAAKRNGILREIAEDYRTQMNQRDMFQKDELPE